MKSRRKKLLRLASLLSVCCSLTLLYGCAGRDVRPELPSERPSPEPVSVPPSEPPQISAPKSEPPQVSAPKSEPPPLEAATLHTPEDPLPSDEYVDGAHEVPPPNLDAIPDAEPKSEPLHPYANRPYAVLGKSYVPDAQRQHYRERGLASWYGRKFHGRKTSVGEIYDMYAMTAAHRTLAIPTYARVIHVESGKSVVVRINDRGPFHSDRIIDLSYTAAHKLGIVNDGTSLVDVEVIDPDLGVVLAAREEKRPMYLQLGAFSARANADRFAAQLKQQLGKAPHLLAVFLKDGLYRAAAGPYRTHKDALEAAEAIRKLVKVKPLVIFR